MDNNLFKKYITDSEQIFITEDINNIAKNLDGDGLEFVLGALKWIQDNMSETQVNKMDYFRKRNTEQIIKDKFLTGCTDYVLVFMALMRAKGIPAKYIETISRDWLIYGNEKDIRGHIFAEIFINNKWHIVDPQAAVIRIIYPDKFVKFAEGLDSWDIGIHNFEELKEKFLEFREKWRKENK